MIIVQYDDLRALPFAYGGRYPVALDCFGLLLEIYRRNGIMLPDVFRADAERWGREGDGDIEGLIDRLFNLHKEWQRVEKPKEGSVLSFSRFGKAPDHVGIALDHRYFVHCASKIGVAVSRIRDSRWEASFRGVYDYVGTH